MNIELLLGGTLPENPVVITCEGTKTRAIASVQREGSAADLQLAKDVDRLNCCRLQKVIDKDDKMDCNELIAYWMMEGYLGRVDSVKEAYKKGHDIFMDFKYVKIPRKEFYDEAMFNCLASDTTYKRYRNFKYSTMGVGFVDVFEDFHTEAPMFKDLVPDNGVLRTLGYGKCSCLLLDGNQLGRQVLKCFTKELEHFAYFNARANVLQCTIRDLMNLSVLVLRGCNDLEEIDDCVGEMANLTVLEISDSKSIKTIPDIFKKVTKLRSLNLSGLAIDTLPKASFAKLVGLRWIILRGCSRLTELPSTRDMTKLEVIDLYGAKSLGKLSTTNFRTHPIKLLDLSHTHTTRVPCLYNHANPRITFITHLFLRNCLKIYVFDIVGKLLSLEVLDVSGSVHLKQISVEDLTHLVVLDVSGTGLSSLDEKSFQNMSKLKILNLSRTSITYLPRFSHPDSLRRLILQGCESLEKLELGRLVGLQFLDVSGCRKLTGLGEFHFGKLSSLISLNLSDTTLESFTIINSSGASSSSQHLESLKILNLSKTSIKELPSLSHLKNLKQLLLANCSNLSSVPDLKTLTALEVLDISGTNMEKEILDKAPSSLHKLLLKDCSKVEGPLPLASFTLLQELDLRGSSVAEIPEKIISAGMTHLQCLRLPHKIDIRRVEWGRMKDCLPKEIYWDQLNIFESVKVVTSSDEEQTMSAKPSNDSHLFRVKDSQDQWEAYFKQIQFSVIPKDPNEENGVPEIQFGGAELIFKGYHPLARNSPYVKPNCPSVEIHGFPSLPEDVKSGLQKATNVALVNNSFISSLTDECFQHMELMKACWINSCTEMKFLLGSEIQYDGALARLEALVLSNLPLLESFCAEKENVASQSIKPLGLEHLYVDCCPVLNKIISASHLPENLQSLHIKFCDNLVDVCGGNSPGCKLAQLHELSLLDLPKLQHIGADLPSLKTLIINQCPELREFHSILQCSRSTLSKLSLESCPQLKHVLSPSMLPEKLTILEIRACDGLTTVFDSAGPSSSTSGPSLRKLTRLQLWNLPKLMSIEGCFPSLEECEIKYCSRLPRDSWPKTLQRST